MVETPSGHEAHTKSTAGRWIGIVVAIVIALLLVWWLLDNDPVETTAMETDLESDVAVEQTAGAAGEVPNLILGVDPEPVAISAVLADPARYVGTDEVGGEFDVSAVPTDRGFWIGRGDERMFALIEDRPSEAPVDINPDQQVRIASARVRDGSAIDEIGGAPLDDRTRAILEDQQVFLLVDEANIEILT